jgi:putative ABC transport system permease protein
MIERLGYDLRHGARLLARTPAFSLIAVVTLALGIGANVALFTVAHAVLLRPLAYAHPERLTLVSMLNPSAGPARGGFSFPRFQFIAAHTRAFSRIGAFFNESFTYTGSGEPEQLPSARVSAGFFPVLGVRPVIGRTFTAPEDTSGGKPVVMISQRFWRERFDARPDILSRTVTLDSRPYTVIGVVPADFQFAPLGARVDIWAPRVFDLNIATPQQIYGGAMYLQAVGRLAPGVGIAGAQAEMGVLDRQYRQAFPRMADASPKLTLVVDNLKDQLVSNVRPTILILMGAVGLVLLIACANVAGLLVSRALGRRREIAIRMALGASRGAVVRQLLAESLLLAILGGCLGALFSGWATRAMLPLLAGRLPRLAEIHTDPVVLAFSLLLSLATGILFGLAPALEVSRADAGVGFRDESRGATASRSRHRLRHTLLISQVALSMVLLVASGLLIRSFARLVSVAPGFDPRNVLTMNIMLPPARYPAVPLPGTPGGPKDSPMIAFFDELVKRAALLPAVRSAALASALPLNPTRFSPMQFEGQPPAPLAERPTVVVETATPAYFTTMRTPLLRGRLFTEHDDAHAARVVIVNQRLARRFWPNDNPIGKHVYFGPKNVPAEVIGVVGDIRNIALAEPARAEVYLPYPQLPTRSMNLILRAAGDPRLLADTARHLVAGIDPGLPVTQVTTMDDLLRSSRVGPRFTTGLLAAFSAMALLLAAIGIYGTISYAVLQRTPELAIRMALGADRGAIVGMVVRQALLLVAAGVAAGAAASLLLARLMASELYGISATDPRTFIASAAVFAAIAVLASAVPARRAMRVDPAAALRFG